MFKSFKPVIRYCYTKIDIYHRYENLKNKSNDQTYFRSFPQQVCLYYIDLRPQFH